MVDFRPFRGHVPNLSKNEMIIDRVSPPYDIISQEELVKLQSHPFNITKITLGAENGAYEKAATLLDSWISSGKLVADKNECFYIYRQSFKDDDRWLSRNGIVGILHVEPYDKGEIIPHEETFPKVKEDRLNLLRATSTHTESIFGLFDRSEVDLEAIGKRAQKLFDCTDNLGTIHAFFRVSDRNDVNAIQQMMSSKKVLIADGHHRYETALKYSTENVLDSRKAYVLCTMVSAQDKGMFVRPTHRLVKNLKVQEKDLIEALRKHFSVREVKDTAAIGSALDAAKVPTFGIMLSNGKKYIIDFTAPQGDILWSVDTYVCQEVIFKSVLYSFPKGNEIEIEYDHDVLSAEKKLKEGAVDLVIMVRAPSLESVWNVAASGRKMPKKTTYFWPKIWSGFVLYRMK